jgi:hypothetical protein
MKKISWGTYDNVDDFTSRKFEPYLYIDRETGEQITVMMSMDQLQERELPGKFLILPNGREYRRALAEELQRDNMKQPPAPRTGGKANWPMKTSIDGVHPSQVQELREHWQEHGVIGCTVDEHGDIEYSCRSARKSDHEARGLYDRSGGYGDAMPQNL